MTDAPDELAESLRWLGERSSWNFVMESDRNAMVAIVDALTSVAHSNASIAASLVRQSEPAVTHITAGPPAGERLPELTCPACGRQTIICWYYRDPATGGHQHTRYACTAWPFHGRRCGWDGWNFPA